MVMVVVMAMAMAMATVMAFVAVPSSHALVLTVSHGSPVADSRFTAVRPPIGSPNSAPCRAQPHIGLMNIKLA